MILTELTQLSQSSYSTKTSLKIWETNNKPDHHPCEDGEEADASSQPDPDGDPAGALPQAFLKKKKTKSISWIHIWMNKYISMGNDHLTEIQLIEIVIFQLKIRSSENVKWNSVKRPPLISILIKRIFSK